MQARWGGGAVEDWCLCSRQVRLRQAMAPCALEAELWQAAAWCSHPSPATRRMLDGAWFLSPEGPYRTLEELWDTQGEVQTSSKG